MRQVKDGYGRSLFLLDYERVVFLILELKGDVVDFLGSCEVFAKGEWVTG